MLLRSFQRESTWSLSPFRSAPRPADDACLRGAGSERRNCGGSLQHHLRHNPEPEAQVVRAVPGDRLHEPPQLHPGAPACPAMPSAVCRYQSSGKRAAARTIAWDALHAAESEQYDRIMPSQLQTRVKDWCVHLQSNYRVISYLHQLP